MTLGEGKNKVYMLLDEHSAGGEVEHDEDIELKMTYFFDIAQKIVAQVKKIVKTRKITPTAERQEYPMPGDFMGVYRIWRDGKPAGSRYRWRGGKLVVPQRDAGHEIVLEYYAIPETIGPDAGDDYEFELSEDACQCLPYYVAAQQLLPDLVMDYSSMLAMYNLALSRLDTSQPGEHGRLAQTFYRG